MRYYTRSTIGDDIYYVPPKDFNEIIPIDLKDPKILPKTEVVMLINHERKTAHYFIPNYTKDEDTVHFKAFEYDKAIMFLIERHQWRA